MRPLRAEAKVFPRRLDKTFVLSNRCKVLVDREHKGRHPLMTAGGEVDGLLP